MPTVAGQGKPRGARKCAEKSSGEKAGSSLRLPTSGAQLGVLLVHKAIRPTPSHDYDLPLHVLVDRLFVIADVVAFHVHGVKGEVRALRAVVNVVRCLKGAASILRRRDHREEGSGRNQGRENSPDRGNAHRDHVHNLEKRYITIPAVRHARSMPPTLRCGATPP